ncbi:MULTISPECIES: hypothetical protein [Sorangium]|uniref:4-vinyl reductase 4VR domain-containing protein n=1 Tax=Sorangium cellulosum TaxID=56 RepID=A0A150QR09_SORCE|nr:hypothetical protein [Sorangium cellulosum]KYF70048.1 hypothetical protein BE15_10310 [Sorangium cellulosum]KYF77524.1 hypothetical protein BE11_07715 [Sorangium cellulosum]
MKTHETKSKSSIPAGRCKGTLLVNLRSFVTTNRDAGAWERLVTSLPKSDRDVLYQPLLPSSWYPIGVWNRALRTHVRSASDQAAEIKRFARYVADRDLNTVMKFALSIAMPDTIVARTGMFWSRYFDSGKVFPRMVKPREWVLTITGPTGDDEGPSAMNCGDGVCGWVEQALLLCGASTPKVTHQRCRFRGATECLSEVVW